MNTADNFTVTGYPLRCALVTKSDTVDLPNPGIVRADAAGAVTVIPYGNPDNTAFTFNLAAGEAVPCVVKRVKSTGTDSITLHVMY